MPEKSVYPDDNINLSGVKNLIVYFFNLFFRFIFLCKLVLLRNRVLIITGTLAGIVVGGLHYVTQTKFYKASMIVEFTELNKKTYAEMIDQLNNLVTTGSYAQLRNELRISDRLAKNLIDIDSRNLNNEHLREDTSAKTRQYFKIIVTLRNNELLDSFQNALIYYFNNNYYLSRLKASQRKIYEDKLTFIEKEMAKLDSLKTSFNHFIDNTRLTATFYNNAMNPSDIYAQSARFAAEKADIVKWLELDGSAVSVVDRFKATASPQSITLANSIAFGGGAGFAVTFLAGLLLEIRKKFNK